MSAKPDRVTLIAFAGVVLLASANIVAVRIGSRELEPFWGAGIRFAMATTVMFVVLVARRIRLPHGRSLLGAASFGVLAFTLAYAFFYWGSQEVPAGLSGVIMGLVPLFTLFLAALQGVERFRPRGLAGAVLASIGIAVVIAEPPGGAVPIASVLAIVAAALFATESGIVVKRIPEADPIGTNAVAMLIGAVLLLALSRLTHEGTGLPTSTAVWVSLVYLGLIGTPALFVLYVFVLNRWTVSGVSYQFVLMPPVTILLGAAIVDESLTGALLIGTPLVLAGVYLGAMSGAERPTSIAPSPSP